MALLLAQEVISGRSRHRRKRLNQLFLVLYYLSGDCEALREFPIRNQLE
jgi:hypothetical protein